jgi:hypothetical protein
LSLAGFTEQQLQEIAAPGAGTTSVTLYSPVTGTVMKKNAVVGQTVDEGSSLYSIADLDTLWVQVQVIESEISAVHEGMPVEISSVAWPGEIFYGTVDFFYPEVDPASRSLKVRVAITNRDGKLKPGMYVNAVIRSPMGRHGSVEEMQIEEAAKSAQAAKVTLPTQDAQSAAQFLAGLADGAMYYTCTMDPQVMSDKPGDCPICNMKFVERHKGKSELPVADADASVVLPTQSKEDAARYLAQLPDNAEYFTCAMHPEVVSDKPGTCPRCNMNLEKRTKSGGSPSGGDQSALAGTFEQWAEGFTCPMHLDSLNEEGGICMDCGCGMPMSKWRIERVLSVPESAVIDTGNDRMVYVETAPGLYDARGVTLGARTGAYYPVLDGLVLGERIVARGAFLVDAEARLNRAASGMGQAAKKEADPTVTEPNGAETSSSGQQH